MIGRESPERTTFFPMQSIFLKPNTAMLCTRSSIFSRTGQLIYDLDTDPDGLVIDRPAYTTINLRPP